MPVPSPHRRLASEPTADLTDPSHHHDQGNSGRADQAVLEEVYRIEAPRLARYFRRRICRNDDPADLVQEAFARLAGYMFRESLTHPASYLQRIARNLLFDRSKRVETKLAAFHVPIDDQFALSVPPDQGLAIEADDMMRAYRQALDTLPEKTRQVFLLHRVEELTYKEIGNRLGISIPAVQYHVARALAHIDAALERE